MVPISRDRVVSLLRSFKNKKILVIGDVMLDRYLWGQVSRLSPEAPVPIVEIEEEYSRLGGAANVGGNLKTLGAVPYLLGVIGDDPAGSELMRLVTEQSFPADGLIKDPGRPTTVKTRVIAHSQHVVRTDKESKDAVSQATMGRVKETIEKLLPEVDAVIFEDYNKGLISEDLIKFVIPEANSRKTIVTVDPKFDHFFAYKGATVFKPNRRETEGIMGERLDSREKIVDAARSLHERLNCDCVLITLGEDGMVLHTEAGDSKFIPTRARKVSDVSGAGSYEEAATLANHAAGIVCGEVGIVPIGPDRLMEGMFGG
jgi:rfaE bifunctional protein kinase chain/domain